MEEMSDETLFITEKPKSRVAYQCFASTMVIAICLILGYRITNISSVGQPGRWPWIGLLVAELWFSFYWVITQAPRWSYLTRYPLLEKLLQRDQNELPGVDIFVCTADPYAEPPSLVISTVLSVMAYDYPPEKLSVYLSDDGGSELTFYAMWEAAQFAKYWLPFCRKNNVEPRSPAAYFDEYSDPCDNCDSAEWLSMKNFYEDMRNRIDYVVLSGKIAEDAKTHKRFSEWKSGMTKTNHPAIVQILIAGREKSAVDNDGIALPTLVYMAREKRPQYHHNFKAGAMNALIRVSSEISNSPIILNVDCDMYSNNSKSVRNALCFFLDEKKGQEIAYVQHPQYFYNITKNDLYGNGLSVVNEVEIRGCDYWGGPLYVGTGCFHRREVLCGRKYSKDYKEDWTRGAKRKENKSASIIEDKAKYLASCTYERNTLWGEEIGLKYDCPVEDVISGLIIQSRGWNSVYFSPPRKGFLGVAPTTVEQTLVQHKRWSEGNLKIFLSKYCPFLLGHGKIKLGLQMSYCIFGLWASNSFPTLYYIVIPPLCFLKGISLFPKVSSLWFIPFAYVVIGRNVYSLAEALNCNDTVNKWWNTQRMWLMRRITSYLYGAISTILKLLVGSKMGFVITAKVSGPDASKRYEQEVMEFGSASPMFIIIAITAFLNLVCLVFGLLIRSLSVEGLDQWFIQIFLCGMVVVLNLPVYKAMFWRKDKGNLPGTVSWISIASCSIACLLVIQI